MPNIVFHTCSMKINISEQILPLLNIASNEHHLAKLQFSTASFTSLFLFLPLTSDSSSASCRNFSQTTPPHLLNTHSGLCLQKIKNKYPRSQCFSSLPCSTVAEKDSFEFWIGGGALTWFTGKCLGCVITEDDRHSVLFCLPRHPGNVLDVMELSDLKRKERVAAAHYLEWTQPAAAAAVVAAAARLNCHLALLRWKCNSS